MRKFLIGLVLVLAVGGAVWAFAPLQRGDERPQYRTLTVEQGTLTKTVTASGTLNPVTSVSVGSQISGQVAMLFADYNSMVGKDQVIARIAPETFEARVDQAKAELTLAQARVQVQEAAVEQADADIANAEAETKQLEAQLEDARLGLGEAARDLKRKRELLNRKVISEATLDASETAQRQGRTRLDAAQARLTAQASLIAARRARLKMAAADVLTAKAQVQQREAALRQADVDLARTYIRSPVNGVVVARNVELGQTVAASLQAPVLFTIAQDLKDMQVEVDVDEADIGQIRLGQTATFTVDTFPGREFDGEVAQIRLEPVTVQNVVTYVVVLAVQNPDHLLLPGMTANVDIVAEQRENVLKVPNVALRFRGPKTDDGARGGDRASQAGARVQRTIAYLIKNLELDEKQQEQLRGFFRDARDQIVSMRQAGAGGTELREAIKKVRQQVREQIPTILSSAQLAKYRTLAARRSANPVTRGRVWVVDAKGGLKAIAVWTAASDGQFSEVVRGKIEAGTAVVTGIEKRAKKKNLFGLGT